MVYLKFKKLLLYICCYCSIVASFSNVIFCSYYDSWYFPGSSFVYDQEPNRVSTMELPCKNNFTLLAVYCFHKKAPP